MALLIADWDDSTFSYPRLELDRLCPPEWALISDDWVMRCKACEHDDRRNAIATYERSAWRNTAHTFCQRHRVPLILGRPGWREEERTEDSDDSSLPLTALESAIAGQISAFESAIERALRGQAPANAAGTAAG
jgi:hypothetical protein